MVFVPFLKMRNEFGGDKAPRLIFEQDKIFRHPCRTRQIENVIHCRFTRRTDKKSRLLHGSAR